MPALPKFQLSCLRLSVALVFVWTVGCRKPAPPPPPPPVAKISTADIHVTAISLGQPRLAIVNGKPLAEGDEVVSAATRLRIEKISDGEVELSSGGQIVQARLLPPKLTPTKR